MFARRFKSTAAQWLNCTNQPLDIGRADLRVSEADDAPAGQERFEVFFGVGDEARAAIVTAAAFDVDPALDLDEGAALDVGEIRAPFALGVKSELALQFRATERPPVERELRFEARGRSLWAIAEAWHGLRAASKLRAASAGAGLRSRSQFRR